MVLYTRLVPSGFLFFFMRDERVDERLAVMRVSRLPYRSFNFPRSCVHDLIGDA